MPLDSAHPYILESHGAEANGVENIFGVDDEWASQQVLDFRKVEGAKLRPSGADDECFNPFGDGVWLLAIMDGSI